ncbi:hypothetical protein [Hungatella hathewayi]|uniref:hypothetical protein n=1 Tax=Hungatella hathewayi TaxID=154046 RepID=UPI003565EA2B
MIPNIYRIDCTKAYYVSEGEIIPYTEACKSILFNTDIISSEEVKELIQSGYIECDSRVILVDKIQADNLFYVKENKNQEEQNEGIN